MGGPDNIPLTGLEGTAAQLDGERVADELGVEESRVNTKAKGGPGPAGGVKEMNQNFGRDLTRGL